MEQIRPFVDGDVAQVARLHEIAVRPGEPAGQNGTELYDSYLAKVFLNHPSRDPEVPSLVYEQDGSIVGFLGVVSRPMSMNGRRLRAAIGSQLVVDPSAATVMIAV